MCGPTLWSVDPESIGTGRVIYRCPTRRLERSKIVAAFGLDKARWPKATHATITGPHAAVPWPSALRLVSVTPAA